MTAQNGGAGEMQLAGLQHDRLVERQAFEFVVFAEKNAEQNGVARELHRHTHFMALRLTARMCPAHTAARQRITEPVILVPAYSHSPSFTRFNVCKLNDENVV